MRLSALLFSRRSAPPAPDAGVRSKAGAALQAALALAGLVGVAAGVFWLMSEPAEEPRSEVRIAAVEDWPEIRDGVPDLARASAVRPEPARTFEPAPAPPNSAAADAPPVAAQGAAVLENAAPPETPPARAESTSIASDAGLPVLAPIPPPAPRRTAQDKPKPRKEQAARLPPERTAARLGQPSKPDEPPPPQSASAQPAPPDDRIKVFGVPLPTGRDIKETFESLGDAVLGRSKRS